MLPCICPRLVRAAGRVTQRKEVFSEPRLPALVPTGPALGADAAPCFAAGATAGRR